MSGYARAHRGRWDHPVFKNKQEAAVWAWMCDTARFREHSFQTRFGIVTLGRGQLLVSERGIADDFGLHKNAVRRILSTMKDAGMISQNRDHEASRAGTIITIVNYEKYQSDSDDDDDRRDHGKRRSRTKTGPRQDQDRTTREEREKREEREEGNSPSDSSNDAPFDTPVDGLPVPLADDAGEALARYSAMRCALVPGVQAIKPLPARRKAMLARLRDVGGLDGWETVLAKIRGSPFLRGETARDGKLVAEIDWLLKPANLTKVIEGNYDERRSGNDGKRSGTAVRTSTVDALRQARAAAGLGRS